MAPPSDLPPEKWQELLAVAIEDNIREDVPYDAHTIAFEAGLTDDEAEQFALWVQEIERRIEERELRNEMSIASDRLMERLAKGDLPVPLAGRPKKDRG